MNNREIQNLIKFVAKSGVAEVKLKDGDFAISIKNVQDQVVTTYNAPSNNMPAVPANFQEAVANPTNQDSATTEKEDDEDKYIIIKSPMIGTFYRKPSPDKPTFINVGDTVKEGDVVCIIEAMKLFNEIESEVSGKIVKVLVDDSTPVEYDQPLFLVDPS